MKKIVYLDNAATTAVRKEVLDEMEVYFRKEYANPASKYRFASAPFAAVSEARTQVAEAIGAASMEEIYFTAGGSESDNWAIQGVCSAAGEGHIITTAFEHHALMNTCKSLEKKGFSVTFLKPSAKGYIDPKAVEDAIRPDTVIISVMYANNEIGTVQPIAEIGAIARKHRITFHTDAVQAAGHIPVDVVGMNADLLSLSAHKFYGPKGVGAMYIKKGTKISPLIFGGMQEFNKRAGTHNVSGIVGLGKALELACEEMEEERERITGLRDKLINGILNNIPHAKLNGGLEPRLPGNVNISFRFIESEAILNLLDFKGICASSGSACNSDSLEASHVLLAIGMSHEEANGTIRFSLGRYNTEEDIGFLLESLPPVVEKLRAMSPLYEDFIKSRTL
ncbi:MAG: cysteine desulfurase NifS [Clostridiales bacterium]|jgi:cysteine desulfurase|nr:cysteine desulfurase NifS [Clostridiales bacterium]